MQPNDPQDSRAFKMTVKWILAGAVIGSAIGIMGLTGIIPADQMLSVSKTIIKAGIGLIVLIIDFLFAFALCQPLIMGYIEKHGKQTNGIIEHVKEIPRPDQLGADEWVRKAHFSLTVKYRAGTKEYHKEFPQTHLTSKQALYPLSLEEGQEIPVKYLDKIPALSLLDSDILKDARNSENKRSRIFFLMIPLIMTAVYIAAAILI